MKRIDMKKKQNVDQSVVTFAIIAIAILAALGLFIFYASDTPVQKAEKDGMKDVYQVLTGQESDTGINREDAPVLDPKEIEAAYNLDLGELLAELQNEERTVEQTFAHAQNRLLGMRVPQSMLDAHLKGVLALRSMQADFENSAEIKTEDIVSLIGEIKVELNKK